jgi:transposase
MQSLPGEEGQVDFGSGAPIAMAVSRADWYDPDLNPKIQSFCEHDGTVILPTKPYTPRHKGKIERGDRLCQKQCVERSHLCQPGAAK